MYLVVKHYFMLASSMYKLDTLLLKQKRFPVLDKTGFIFRIRTRVFIRTRPSPEYECRKRNPFYPMRALLFFNSAVSYSCIK
jgi:hypothetical protein